MSLLHTLRGLASTGRISVPTVIDAALGRVTMARCDERLDWWARELLRDAEVELTVRGREHVEQGQSQEPFVVMSNHQSLYDIPVIFCAIPGRVRMVAKSELFKVPIWGAAMTAAGFIRIDRSDREQAVKTLSESGSMLKDGTHVWIAPEGTRSATGALGPFKSGGFRMALEAGARILPVAVDGTRHVLPAKGAIVQTKQRVTVTICAPIDPRAYGLDRRKELMADVRAAIEGALAQRAAVETDRDKAA
jgi:1-acyl-sn-glycerol-3-phosphate acyltransferase